MRTLTFDARVFGWTGQSKELDFKVSGRVWENSISTSRQRRGMGTSNIPLIIQGFQIFTSTRQLLNIIRYRHKVICIRGY